MICERCKADHPVEPPEDPWRAIGTAPHVWQGRALTSLYPRLRCRVPQSPLVHACTGAGKTVLMCGLIASARMTLRAGWFVVVVVPRIALVTQTVRDLGRRLGQASVSAWYGRTKQLAQVVVVCIDSLRTFIDRFLAAGQRCGLLIVDECHRAEAPRAKAELARLGAFHRVGLSATPFRRDEEHPLEGWDDVAVTYPIDQGIADTVLVPWRPVYSETDNADLDGEVLRMIEAHAPPGPVLVSASTQEDARLCAAYLTRRGMPAATVYSGNRAQSEANDRALADWLAGRVRVVVHVDMLTEGVDIPSIRTIVCRAPRESHVAILQELGRGLRPVRTPDQWGDKHELVVLIPRPKGAYGIMLALSRRPNIGSVELSRALADGGSPTKREVKTEASLPPAQAVAEVGAWLRALSEAVRGAGVRLPTGTVLANRQMEPSDDWRRGDASALDAQELATWRKSKTSPVRYLRDETHREAVYALLAQPGMLTAGQANELARICVGLGAKAREWAQAHRHQPEYLRYWRGVAGIGSAPPELAIRTITRPTQEAA